MKYVFLTLFISIQTWALSKPDLPANTFDQIEIFSKKSLDLKNDSSEVSSIIKILLILDEEDPSRTAVMLLSQSYNKYSKIYDTEFKKITTEKNKDQIKEIKMILAEFNKNGNG